MTQIPEYPPRTFEQRKAAVLDLVAEALLKMWIKERGGPTIAAMIEQRDSWQANWRRRKKEPKQP